MDRIAEAERGFTRAQAIDSQAQAQAIHPLAILFARYLDELGYKMFQECVLYGLIVAMFDSSCLKLSWITKSQYMGPIARKN